MKKKIKHFFVLLNLTIREAKLPMVLLLVWNFVYTVLAVYEFSDVAYISAFAELTLAILLIVYLILLVSVHSIHFLFTSKNKIRNTTIVFVKLTSISVAVFPAVLYFDVFLALRNIFEPNYYNWILMYFLITSIVPVIFSINILNYKSLSIEPRIQ